MNLFEKYEQEKTLRDSIQVGSFWICIKLDSSYRGWIVKITHNPKKGKENILIKKWNTSGIFRGDSRITDINNFIKSWIELK